APARHEWKSSIYQPVYRGNSRSCPQVNLPRTRESSAESLCWHSLRHARESDQSCTADTWAHRVGVKVISMFNEPFWTNPDSIPWERTNLDGTRSATLIGTRDSGVLFTYAFHIPAGLADE